MTGDRVADPTTTLAAHVATWDGDWGHWACTCLWRGESRAAHAAHVLAVLAEEGWAVVRADAIEYGVRKEYSFGPIIQGPLDEEVARRVSRHPDDHGYRLIQRQVGEWTDAARAAEGVDQ